MHEPGIGGDDYVTGHSRRSSSTGDGAGSGTAAMPYVSNIAAAALRIVPGTSMSSSDLSSMAGVAWRSVGIPGVGTARARQA